MPVWRCAIAASVGSVSHASTVKSHVVLGLERSFITMRHPLAYAGRGDSSEVMNAKEGKPMVLIVLLVSLLAAPALSAQWSNAPCWIQDADATERTVWN